MKISKIKKGRGIFHGPLILGKKKDRGLWVAHGLYGFLIIQAKRNPQAHPGR